MTDYIARRYWNHAAGAPEVRVDPMDEFEAAIGRLPEIDLSDIRPRRAPCQTCGFTLASRPCSTACTARTP